MESHITQDKETILHPESNVMIPNTNPSGSPTPREPGHAKHSSKRKINILAIILVLLVLMYGAATVFTPNHAKAIVNARLQFKILPITISVKDYDLTTAKGIIETVNTENKNSESFGNFTTISAAVGYDDQTAQPLIPVQTDASSYEICANFKSNGNYRNPNTNKDFSWVGGKNCISFPIDYGTYYTRDTEVDTGAYVNSIDDSVVRAFRASNNTRIPNGGVTATITTDTKYFDSNNNEVTKPSLQIGYPANFYWRVRPIKDDKGYITNSENYVYKIIIVKSEIDPRICQDAISGLLVRPIALCPETYLNKAIYNLNIPERFVSYWDANTQDNRDSITLSPEVTILSVAGKPLPFSALKVDQKFNFIFTGIKVSKLQLIN